MQLVELGLRQRRRQTETCEQGCPGSRLQCSAGVARRQSFFDSLGRLSSLVMHPRRVVERECGGKRVAELAGEPQRFLVVPDRPVWIPLRPSSEGREREATDASIVPPVDRRVGTMALGIVACEALSTMEFCGLEVAAAVQGRPQRVVGFEKEDGILTLPGQVASEPEINVESEEPSPKPVAPPERGVQ